MDDAGGRGRPGGILHRCRRRLSRHESPGPSTVGPPRPRASAIGTCAIAACAGSRAIHTCPSARPLTSCNAFAPCFSTRLKRRWSAIKTAASLFGLQIPLAPGGRPGPPDPASAHPRPTSGRPADPCCRGPGDAGPAACRGGADVPRTDLARPGGLCAAGSPARGHRSDADPTVSSDGPFDRVLAASYGGSAGSGRRARCWPSHTHSPGSPMESVLRWLLHEAGLPAPVLQHVVTDPDGRFLGQVDLAWPDQRGAREFDGNCDIGSGESSSTISADKTAWSWPIGGCCASPLRTCWDVPVHVVATIRSGAGPPVTRRFVQSYELVVISR